MIRQSNSNQGSIGSQQSICSAEEVNPESDDAVFEEEEEEDDEDVIQTTRDDNEINRHNNHKRHYGNRLTGRSISLSDDPATASHQRRTHRRHHHTHNENNNDEEEQSSSSTSHPQRTESPPKWIPDNAAPRCMSCESQFTAFRRRHHCRCCGQVFCGVCSAATTPLPRYGLTKPVRVCRICFVREATT